MGRVSHCLVGHHLYPTGALANWLGIDTEANMGGNHFLDVAEETAPVTTTLGSTLLGPAVLRRYRRISGSRMSARRSMGSTSTTDSCWRSRCESAARWVGVTPGFDRLGPCLRAYFETLALSKPLGVYGY